MSTALHDIDSLSRRRITALLSETIEPFGSVADLPLEGMLERIGESRAVLIGEASHGTSEFYSIRARITRELIEKRGFNVVAIEGDWPDASRIDRYVRHLPRHEHGEQAFARFPTWMWRNEETAGFVEWLRDRNGRLPRPTDGVRFTGLDLYSLYTSIAAVIAYLDTVDPEAAKSARERYSCFSPWRHEPAAYGRAALTDPARRCQAGAVAMLREIFERRLDYANRDGERYWDALQNARLIADAEGYYRVMYHGSVESWNFRDRHMFETLKAVFAWGGDETKVVVWAHNSHLGDAGATEMSTRGEINLGLLCRRQLDKPVWLIGQGTNDGTVAAASDWGAPMKVMDVLPARSDSYESLFHEAGVRAGVLALSKPLRSAVADELREPRLQRAIGVIYRPETERRSHYFAASLPLQFDDYIWTDRTSAVRPLPAETRPGLPETWPFGL